MTSGSNIVSDSGRTVAGLFLTVFLLLTLCVPAALRAGDRDTRGKEFWVAFMADNGNIPSSDLRLYVACDKPTTVYVIYTLTNDTLVVPVTQPNQTVEININNSFQVDAELKSSDQGVTLKSFHILADDDITLYGVSVNTKSADSFLGLPDKVLTGRYIVLAYPNGFSNFGGVPDYDQPSEFAIVGTEDNTTVRISPPTGVLLNGRSSDSTFSVILNRGDVYFGQTLVDVDEEDVSGTEILANKPVAVFGGNARTSVPTNVGNYRDHLCEQIPPLDAWGNDGIVPPLYNITPTSAYTAAIRVLAAFDGTTWTVDGVPQPGLRRGKSVEVPLTTKPLVIKADKPILIGQYEHSVGMDDPDFPGQPALGDPFMLIVPPSEQFDTAYAFQSITHPEFPRHFINVVIPSVATGSLVLDNMPVNAVFVPVPGTSYSYAQIELQNGAHFIRCDSAFGLYVYGYGRATSYGNTGGMLFRKLVTDFYAPEILAVLRCGVVRGIAYDSRITDSGVDSCYATRDTANVVLTIQPFLPQADTVYYTATLLDPYQDGKVGIKAIDSLGRSRTQVNPIPGFTLRAQGMTGNAPAVTDTLWVYNGRQYCRDVVIENYGRFPHTITNATFGGNVPGTLIRTPLPATIAPGGSLTVQLCVGAKPDTSFTMDLVVGDSCTSRIVALIPVVSLIDTTAPRVDNPLPCGNNYQVTFSDPSGSGIVSLQLDTIINGAITFDPALDRLPASVIHGNIRWIDRRQDLIYEVVLKDRAGNTVIERDTVGGFTVAVLQANDTVGLRVGRDWMADTLSFGSNRCDSIIVANYGSHAVQIGQIIVRNNTSFSIPPSQLPIVVAPGSQRKIVVCISSRHDPAELDTLVLSDGCGIDELVALQAPTQALTGLGADRCNTRLQLRLYGASKRVFLQTPVPNPSMAGQQVQIDIGMDRAHVVTIELLDMQGIKVSGLIDAESLPAGIHRLRMDVGGLRTGAYLLRMRTEDGGVFSRKMIVGR